MIALLSGLVRWTLRNLAALLLIVLVLYGGNLLLREWREYGEEVVTAVAALPGLRQGRTDLEQIATQSAAELEQRLARLQQAPAAMIDARIATVQGQLAGLQASGRGSAERALSLLSGRRDELVDDFRRDMQIGLAKLELGRLQSLRHDRTLETLRRRHAASHAALVEATPAGEPMTCPLEPDSWRATLAARLAAGGMRRLALCRENQLAFEAYRAFRDRRIPGGAASASAIEVARHAVEPVATRLEEAQSIVSTRAAAVVVREIMGYLPMALAILLSALVIPLLTKTFLYFIVAPIASRRPPIQILAGAPGGAPDTASPQAAPVSTASAVSREVLVLPHEELLVHADYLQSSGAEGVKTTKWLLHAGYPVASIAAGMTVLTRVRPLTTESVVLSSTADPFSEIGIVPLEAGDALVLQPRCLVAVLQARDRPVRITSHWRLGSLTAWLTLQLRYLVFHGPGTLVIKGCRGIRLEAAGAPRMINQAATIGFSANLSYSTVRTETFIAYLLGRQQLFNDRFTGGTGYFVYEEMPGYGRKSGITGRGLQGIVDSLLKVFGI